MSGSHVFNVAINGTQVLSNFDIWSAAGGENIAVAKVFQATALSSGTITVSFTSVANNSIINGIEIYTTSTHVGPYLVTKTTDDGTTGTLRDAINQVNGGNYNEIDFNIPGHRECKQ